MCYLHSSGFIMRFFLIFSFILFFFFEGYSQSKEGAFWYWGNRAGLNFNQNPVAVDTIGQTSFTHQWATISDSLGRLLFYTNGIKIYNQNHQLVLTLLKQHLVQSYAQNLEAQQVILSYIRILVPMDLTGVLITSNTI